METKEFSILNSWLGWGAPENGLWFVGVEEGSTWNCNNIDELSESRKQISLMSNTVFTSYLDRESRGGVRWPIAVVSAKISSLVSNSGLSWQSYREEILWLNSSGVFNGNLLSLGKPNLKSNSWPAGYKDLFGFSEADYEFYMREVRRVRYSGFRELRKKTAPQAIVCFGMSHWNEFENLFVNNPDIKSECIDKKTIVFERDRVILTRHFSNGMPDSTVKFIAEQLKSWNVSLF